MTGRKSRALQILPDVPYKALENFSKALYGTTERYLQFTRFPSSHVLFTHLVESGNNC